MLVKLVLPELFVAAVRLQLLRLPGPAPATAAVVPPLTARPTPSPRPTLDAAPAPDGLLDKSRGFWMEGRTAAEPPHMSR